LKDVTEVELDEKDSKSLGNSGDLWWVQQGRKKLGVQYRSFQSDKVVPPEEGAQEGRKQIHDRDTYNSAASNR